MAKQPGLMDRYLDDINKNKGNNPKNEDSEKQEKQSTPKEISKETVKKKKKSKNSLENLKEIINSQEFNANSILYVDDDLHEVLIFLKQKAGIKMSSLGSYLIKEFALEYKDEIKKLKNNNNKYLD